MDEKTKAKIGKMGPYDIISPAKLLDVAIDGYPIPWTFFWGHGHEYIYNAKDKPVFHVYCRNEEDRIQFNRKMQNINGDDRQY